MKARIRALAAKTVERGCSEAEAMLAAAKVGELLEVYGLSMGEVELREEACVQTRLAAHGPGRLALRWLFPSVLRFCECRGWTDGRQDFVLFGLEPDVQMAEYLLRVIEGALAWEEARYRRTADYPRQPAAGPVGAAQLPLWLRRPGRQAAGCDGRRTPAGGRGAAPAAPAGEGGSTALVVAKERKVEAGFRELGVRLRICHQHRHGAGPRRLWPWRGGGRTGRAGPPGRQRGRAPRA